jgi:hypothetical protein
LNAISTLTCISRAATVRLCRYYGEIFPTQETDNAEAFFIEKFIHPSAWELVLRQCNKLRLCLAHTGGSEWEKDWEKSGTPEWIIKTTSLMNVYPNLYSDISCFNYKDEKTKRNLYAFFTTVSNIKYRKRIMFGTDWYLSGIVGARQQYDEYCTGYKNLLDSIDPYLWTRLAVLNPFRFYQLDNPDLLNNYKTALTNNIIARKKLNAISISEKK